ncbi:hypothetical protein TWF481_001380 [Arthrobotrys musiformis]|uniref:C2H2-type domain-containing protein n=1 Tax=Arthrobotrys musiformis TaxID=47236 RepID=A0AAV9WQI6_9PEZI
MPAWQLKITTVFSSDVPITSRPSGRQAARIGAFVNCIVFTDCYQYVLKCLGCLRFLTFPKHPRSRLALIKVKLLLGLSHDGPQNLRLVRTTHNETATTHVLSDPPAPVRPQARRKRIVKHECELCPASFTSQRGFDDHSRDVHGTSNHTCERCGRDFPRFDNLRTHQKTCEGNLEQPQQAPGHINTPDIAPPTDSAICGGDPPAQAPTLDHERVTVLPSHRAAGEVNEDVYMGGSSNTIDNNIDTEDVGDNSDSMANNINKDAKDMVLQGNHNDANDHFNDIDVSTNGPDSDPDGMINFEELLDQDAVAAATTNNPFVRKSELEFICENGWLSK